LYMQAMSCVGSHHFKYCKWEKASEKKGEK
jgi:hypothetical protein